MNKKLPKGWRVRPLEQVAVVRTGVTVNRVPLKDPVRLPYLRVANVQAGRLDLREVKNIEIERHQIDRFSLQAGDVLMTEGGDYDKLGRGDLWPGAINPCLHQNHVFAVRVDRGQVLPGFLNALSNSAHGRRYFLSCAKRSTNLASINVSQLRSFPVLLPPLEEQERICEILSKLDTYSTKCEAIVANQRATQTGLRQTLLAGRATRQWRQVALSDLMDVPIQNLSMQHPQDFSFRYIPLGAVVDGRIGELERFSLAQAPSRARRLVQAGDILFSNVRPNLKGYARIDAAFADCVVSTGFTVLRPKNGADIDANYLFHALFSSDLQNQIKRYLTGSSYPTIHPRDVCKLMLPIPPLKAQRTIAAILDKAGNAIALAERQQRVFQGEKLVWIQRLVSGKWRFKLGQRLPF